MKSFIDDTYLKQFLFRHLIRFNSIWMHSITILEKKVEFNFENFNALLTRSRYDSSPKSKFGLVCEFYTRFSFRKGEVSPTLMTNQNYPLYFSGFPKAKCICCTVILLESTEKN